MAFAFPLDTAGNVGAVKTIRGGDDFVVPMLDVVGTMDPLSVAPLAANATFTLPSVDRLSGGMLESRLRFYTESDVAGTLNIEESHDGTTWVLIGAAQAVAASTMADSGWRTLSRRYWRVRYVNGATVQTRFSLYETRDTVVDDVVITGTATVSGTVALGAGAAAIGTVTAAQATAANLQMTANQATAANHRVATGTATTGGALALQLTGVVATPQTVKGTAGTLYSLQVYNPSAAVAFLQVFNVAAPTVGTTVPVQSFAVAAGMADDITLPDCGVAFGTAITVAATTTSRGAAAPATGLEVSCSYA